MRNNAAIRLLVTLGCALAAATASAQVTPARQAAAAQFSVLLADDPGTGFLDPTPVAPGGGNPGTTLGE